jgi:hypothetical protein
LNAPQNPLTKLDKFEDLLERLIELPFELFPTLIEPIELGKKLCKFMARHRLLMPDGRQFVPHVYDIFVSEKDYENLFPSEKVLIQNWRQQLNEYARQRNYIVSGTFVLRLHKKRDLRVGKVGFEVGEVAGPKDVGTQRIDKDQILNWANLGEGGGGPPQSGPAPVAPLPPSQVQAHVPMPQARLTRRPSLGNQGVDRIEKPHVRIGRQLDNDVIVPDKNVGRYHAVIEYQGGQFILKDLETVNGTTVNKVPVMGPRALRNNDVIMIGKYEFLFERR